MKAIINRTNTLGKMDKQQIETLLSTFNREQLRTLARKVGVPQGRVVSDTLYNITRSPRLKEMALKIAIS